MPRIFRPATKLAETVPGPERRNSPLQTDPGQSLEPGREQIGDEPGGCYFNDVLSAEGNHVLSGSSDLRCEGGVWVEAGAQIPVSP